MVAAHIERGERADTLDDLVWTAPVADRVAEIPDRVEATLLGFEDGCESFEVGVDVGQDEDAHEDE